MVTVSPPASTVSIGAEAPLQAIVQDASGQTISNIDVHWSVQDPSIATISNSGVVTGVALGTTQVAASAGGKSGIGTITVQKTPVATVAVTPTHVDASPGDHPQFSATAFDASQNPLAGRAVTWSTSNVGVATVDANGKVSALSPGNATVTATSEGKSGTATITISQAAVATVVVTPSPLSMSVGQATQFTATLKDAIGSVLNGRAVSWSSADPTVATVSSQGLVTAVAAGSTTITATSEGKSGAATVTITKVAVGSVTIEPSGPSILPGANISLGATVRDVNGNVVTDRLVTWSSSNFAVATISSSGVLTGVAAGTTTITANSEGKAGTTVATVLSVPVGSVAISPATASTHVGSTTTLAATVKDQNGVVVTNRVVTWASSNPSVATVTGGVVTGVKIGTATISATSEGKSGSAAVTVTAIPVGSVAVSPASASLSVNQTVALTATVKDSVGTVVTDRSVTWSSSDNSIATVSGAGVVSAVASGSATITATSEGKSGASAITVAAQIGAVTVTPSPDSAYVGQSVTLTGTALDKKGNPVPSQTFSWSSKNPSIATVTQDGVVKGVANGSTTITATVAGQSGQATVKVIAPVASVSVSPSNPPAIDTKTNITLQATLRDASNATIGPGRVVTWTTSDSSIASVTPTAGYSATVRSNKAGTAIITATSEGKSGTATITVKH